jgi:hypothetical protein
MSNKSTWQFPVTWLLAIVLIFTAWHTLALILRIAEWKDLNSIQLSIAPMALILSSFFWASYGLAIIWSIFGKKHWAIKLIWSWVIMIGVSMLINRLLLMDDQIRSSLSILQIGLYMSGIGLTTWTLKQKGTRAHFGVHNE